MKQKKSIKRKSVKLPKYLQNLNPYAAGIDIGPKRWGANWFRYKMNPKLLEHANSYTYDEVTQKGMYPLSDYLIVFPFLGEYVW